MKTNFAYFVQNKYLKLFFQKQEIFFVIFLVLILAFGLGIVYWEGKINKKKGLSFSVLAFNSSESAIYFKNEKELAQSNFFIKNYSNKTISCKINVEIKNTSSALDNFSVASFDEKIKEQEKKDFTLFKIQDKELSIYLATLEKIDSNQNHFLSIKANCEKKQYQIEKPLKIFE